MAVIHGALGENGLLLMEIASVADPEKAAPFDAAGKPCSLSREEADGILIANASAMQRMHPLQ
jgi:hypothetical protein